MTTPATRSLLARRAAAGDAAAKFVLDAREGRFACTSAERKAATLIRHPSGRTHLDLPVLVRLCGECKA